MKPCKLLPILFVLLGLLSGSSKAATVTIAWDANVEPDLSGYYVYWGSTSRGSATNSKEFIYDSRLLVGVSADPSITFGGVPLNTTNYLTITAFDSSDNESDFSAELSFVREDLDGDGMLDSWETFNGLNPADASDGGLDEPDGDGYSNRQEYVAGLDPKVVDPVQVQISRVGSVLTLAVPTALGREYTVMYSDMSTFTAVWTELGRFDGSGFVESFQDDTIGAQIRSYHLEVSN